MTHSSVLIRVHKNFKQKIEEIMKHRQNNSMTKLSYNKITLLYTRHNGCNKIDNDIINYEGFDDDE